MKEGASMRRLDIWVWTALLVTLSAAPATAQQGGINPGGQPVGGVNLGGGSNLSGGLTSSGLAGLLNTTNAGGGSGIGAGGLGGRSGGLGGGIGGTQGGIGMQAGRAGGAQGNGNMFTAYYANPYAIGLTVYDTTSQTMNARLGNTGFGTPVYNATGGAAGGRGGLGTNTAANTFAAGGRSGGGIGGANSNQSGVLIPIPVQIAYVSEFRFTPPPIPVGKIQSDLRASLDNTSLIANSKAVEVITDAKNNVILRGKVKDEDEVRLIEGIVRLTPGVGDIKNELTFDIKK
jgi:hypothetical protein